MQAHSQSPRILQSFGAREIPLRNFCRVLCPQLVLHHRDQGFALISAKQAREIWSTARVNKTPVQSSLTLLAVHFTGRMGFPFLESCLTLLASHFTGRMAAQRPKRRTAEWPRSGQKIEIQSHFTGLSFYWPAGKNIRNFTLVAGQLSATRLYVGTR